MKQGKLIQTRNVAAADACVAELKARPKLEMVGLGLIYGAPGLGKTTYAQRSALPAHRVYLHPVLAPPAPPRLSRRAFCARSYPCRHG